MRDRHKPTKVQERAIDEYLRSKSIEPLPNPDEAAGLGDRLIDDERTEYKTLSKILNASADTISGAIANRAMNARSQASHVVIDARNQAGMSEAIAKRGIIRAFAADTKEAVLAVEAPKIWTIRVIFKDERGKDSDILIPRS